MTHFVHKQLMRFSHAGKGIQYALVHDQSFKLQVIAGAIFIFGIFFVLHPLDDIEQLILLLAWFIVLITELQNSAFEEALDKLHPEQHEQIGKSKDMASGSVLLAGIFALVCTAWILLRHMNIL